MGKGEMKRLGIRFTAPAVCTPLLLGLLLGCGGAPPAGAEQESAAEAVPPEASSALQGDPAPAPVSGGEAPDSLMFSERVVVFLEGTAEDIKAVRGEHDEEDFHVTADDAMYYRASAHEYLEQHRLPVKTIQGRRPLYFLVGGMVRRIDLSAASTLDVIVLYDKDREPCIVAPINVYVAEGYFGGARGEDEVEGCK